MAIRTSDQLIRASIETDPDLNLTPFINRANALTDYVASKDSQGVLSVAMLREIETLLACHFYDRIDHAYAERATGKASGVFQGQYGMHLDGTKWGQDAITMDVSGTLSKLSKGTIKAQTAWLGKAPSEQTDYVDRD